MDRLLHTPPPLRYPRRIPSSACISLSTLKIFCQAHSFDHNSAESMSSLGVQAALGAWSAPKSLPAIHKKKKKKLTQPLFKHSLASYSLISPYCRFPHTSLFRDTISVSSEFSQVPITSKKKKNEKKKIAQSLP